MYMYYATHAYSFFQTFITLFLFILILLSFFLIEVNLIYINYQQYTHFQPNLSILLLVDLVDCE